MPFINLKTNVNVTKESSIELKNQFGELISILPGKSETWLMVEVEGNKEMYFRGTDEPLAILEVKVYGNSLDDEKSNKLTSALTEATHKILKVPSDRIYVAYFLTSTWGFAGENF